MNEFRSAYSGQVRHTSLTGNGHEPEYEYKVTDEGRELVKTGETDVYALIQSRLDETKIENIIKRATYDPTTLGSQEWKVSGTMTDISDMPTNYHEWYARIKEAEAEFEKLPVEVKNKWDNDVEKYIMAYGTEDWADKMGILTKADDTTQQNESNEGVSK
ncbi:VP3 [Gokushovirinae sp.]|nr:VP3 [Gokushovirinae sp.]